MKRYNVSWSGGLDSTLIVTQLSRFPVIIRPFYFKGQTFRQSEPQELEAIETVRNLLLADSRTKAELLPLSILEKNDSRLREREIVIAHRSIYIQQLEEYKNKRNGTLPLVGSHQTYVEGGYISQQYIACASLAKNLGEPIELGLVNNDSEADILLNQATVIIQRDETVEQDTLCLAEGDNEKAIYKLFKNCHFPLLGQKMYKRDVWQWYSDHGYLDVRSKTNSCQNPIKNENGVYEPCGICNPCITLIRGNVKEPFSEKGLARYYDYEQNHEKEPQRFRQKEF